MTINVPLTLTVVALLVAIVAMGITIYETRRARRILNRDD